MIFRNFTTHEFQWEIKYGKIYIVEQNGKGEMCFLRHMSRLLTWAVPIGLEIRYFIFFHLPLLTWLQPFPELISEPVCLLIQKYDIFVSHQKSLDLNMSIRSLSIGMLPIVFLKNNSAIVLPHTVFRVGIDNNNLPNRKGWVG